MADELEMPSDAELFEASEAEKETVETKEQPRDESGKFAAKEPEPVEPPKAEAPPSAPKQEERDTGQIPAWRLKEEADARRQFERELQAEREARAQERAQLQSLQQRLQSLEKPKEAEPEVDPLLDPQGFVRGIKSEFEQRLLNERRELQMEMARDKHGKLFEEAYTEARKAMAQGDIQLQSRMNNARNVGEELISWHKEQQVRREVGNDINAWREKQKEAFLSDPSFLAMAMERARGIASSPNAPVRPAVNLPPSLSDVSRGSVKAGADDDNDVSDEALFSYALRR